MMNKELYQIGCKEFESRKEIKQKDLDAVDNIIADMAESAYYNDCYGCQSEAEAYYLITEAYGIETGNEWLAEMIENGRIEGLALVA